MNTKKIKLLQKIELLINNTINDLAISESYDLILYENAAFVSDEVNITNKVIQRIQNNSL
jgi:Skp family chaperone for outer membrane proteins